ncbi:hypothetical protein SLS60_003624 [Paraconiothyrium brasiliense]|uniref:Uncharacterized protein n=1 Tax=Paraconiothyrium brasiliense TaxID=300254 RepID=A0ABR3RPU1_9PLEO
MILRKLLARKNPTNVAGLVFMKFIHGGIQPEDIAGWEVFEKFRTEGVGRQLIIEENAFVEVMLGQTGPEALKGDQNRIPKLIVWAEPGALLPSHKVHQVEDWLHNWRTTSVGPGRHFLQEDNPHLIGAETKRFIEEVMNRK